MPQAQVTSYFAHQLLRARDWQHRPQLDEVCKWWRDGGRGVLALIGMGGAGKTAIAERFLRVLPGGLPEDPDIAKDGTLRKPDSVFVFSFYDAPTPEAFFETIQMWLEDSPRIESVLSLQQLYFKLQNTSGLLVLDGLEKVQEDGVRGLLGRLASPKLREFLDRIAAGYFSALSVLVTSRFPLADLRDARPQFFRLLPIDEIEVPAGVELLRARGVRGTNLQLASIVEACGRHALTVDFAGGYIAEFGGGDPSTPVDFKMDSAELLQKLDDEPDDARRHVLKQGHRFARLAERYRDAMLGNTSTGSDGDAAALALLQRICLFRLGVDTEMLASIFTGEKAVKVSGPALAGLSRPQLQKKLDWLVRMRIVEASKSNWFSKTAVSGTEDHQTSKTLYTIHPAVRDGFLSGLTDDELRENHVAVLRRQMFSLGEAPGQAKLPSDPNTLDLLEEILYHTIGAGYVQRAWQLYSDRMGGYANLGVCLGENERGHRLCYEFVRRTLPSSTDHPEKLSKYDLAEIHVESMLYLTELGRLSDANEFFVRVRWSEELMVKNSLCRAAYQSVTNSSILRGYLGNASKLCFEAYQKTNFGSSWLPFRYFQTLWCSSIGLQGQPVLASRYFDSALEWDTANQKPSHANKPWDLYRYAELLLKFGRLRKGASVVLSAFQVNDDPMWLPKPPHEYSFASQWDGDIFSGLSQEMIGAVSRSKSLWKKTTVLDRNRSREQTSRKFDPSQRVPIAKLKLLDAEFSLEAGDWSTAMKRVDEAVEWAEARSATEVLCWSSLIQLRLERSKLIRTKTEGDRLIEEITSQSFSSSCSSHIANGLKIARDCGYGIYHIELLLARARLHLLSGEPQAALDDLRTALDEGVPANEQAGQPELIAATHPECGYAWAIAEGLQLRGEALLLQAAQLLRTNLFSQNAQESGLSNENPAIDPDATAFKLRNEATSCLYESINRWQPLHDPEPERPDQNFELDGKPYNYRAAETYRILTDLNSGVLTRYPLTSRNLLNQEPMMKPASSKRFDIALSFPGEHREFVEGVAEHLSTALDHHRVLYDKYYEAEFARLDLDVYLPPLYREQSELVVVFLCPEYQQKRWCKLEWRHVRQLIATTESGRIMLVSFGTLGDLTELGIVSGDGYVNIGARDPAAIADLILQRFHGTSSASPTLTTSPPTRTTATAPANTGNHAVIEIWRKKLAMLQVEEAKAFDPAAKFKIQEDIEEAKRKISELGGST